MDGSTLELRVRRAAQHLTVVTAVGDVDLSTVEALRRSLLGSLKDGDVILDASGITFCSSTGVSALAEADRVARAAGYALRVAAPPEAVIQVLDLAGFQDIIRVYPDVETALSA
jgi:anti-anti-sigma factor